MVLDSSSDLTEAIAEGAEMQALLVEYENGAITNEQFDTAIRLHLLLMLQKAKCRARRSINVSNLN